MTTFIAGIAVGMLIDLLVVVILRRQFRDALDILIERMA
jgi:hypothetical protein